MSRAAYEIRAVGDVPRQMLEDFEGVTVTNDPAGSTIHVMLGDDAELHGLLEALNRAGFVLIDVRRDHVPDSSEDWEGEAPPPPGPGSAV